MNYCVFRSDLMFGTDNRAGLVSCRVYDNDETTQIEVQNGTIVELKGFEEGQREVYKAVLATASSKLENCVVIGSVETMYDERKHNLDEFVNEKGVICRGYRLHVNDLFSITEPGIDGDMPTVGAEVGIGEKGKIKSGATGLGTCEYIELAGRYTYYTIKVAG
ncbi:MAG: hypothetical protein KH138_04585 [Firmicutes bacterium]|nr:hypothetical protein [Bacillota bacterium]